MKATVTTKLAASASLSEIYQSMDMQQALVKKTGSCAYERITAHVKCRDFLVDTYSFSLAKKDFGIYGFSFPSSKQSPDWDAARLLLRFPNEKAKANFTKHLGLLQEAETKNGFEITKIIPSEDLEIVCEGDAKWLVSCLAFSFYSLLLRVLCYEFPNKGDWLATFAEDKDNYSDAAYIASIHPETRKRIMDDLSLLKMKEWCGLDPTKHSTSAVHHNSGLISVVGYHSELHKGTVKQNTHWQYFKDKGFKLATV